VNSAKIIVVGCDGSWHSHRAVTAATYEAVRRGAELTVLTVPTMGDLRSYHLGDMARCEQDALSTATGMASTGLAWAREVDPAVRARALVLPLDAPELAALMTTTELLVLGGHGKGGQRAFSLGSTSLQLAHAAVAPLLLAAPDGPVGKSAHQPTVVVGLDSQPWSSHALAYAVAQAAMRAAALVVVRALLPGQPRISAAIAGAERDCAVALEHESADLAKVKVLVTVAPVIDALLGACTPNSLLVLGNRGAGRLRGPVPGSLTQKLMEAAVCDVVLVPTRAGENRVMTGSAAVPQPV
jgi:nucleotide-binding universal stress UspA family protein